MLNEAQGRYIGQPKERYEWVLKFITSHTTSRGYYVHNYVDRDGNSVIAFADEPKPKNGKDKMSGELDPISEGSIFRCKATVNRHAINTFQGNNMKQTIINRMSDIHKLYDTELEE